MALWSGAVKKARVRSREPLASRPLEEGRAEHPLLERLTWELAPTRELRLSLIRFGGQFNYAA